MAIENGIQRRLIRVDSGGYVMQESHDGSHWVDVPEATIRDVLASRIPPIDVSSIGRLPPGRFMLSAIDETIEAEIEKRVAARLREAVEREIAAKQAAESKTIAERYSTEEAERQRAQQVGAGGGVPDRFKVIELD